MPETQIMNTIKKILRTNACVNVDAHGYVPTAQDNLVPGIRLNQFEADLQQGGGHELHTKFRALHSSSALAVNAFAAFKDYPADLWLLGNNGFGPPTFEHQLPTGLKGIPPTLDVFFRCGEEVVAIESKFLEYFTAKRAKFASSYSRLRLPWAEHVWWQVVEDSKKAGKRYLDVAQLVKHYFGLCRLFEYGDSTGWKPTKATLLYLFWEPANPQEIDICVRHRQEIEALAADVSESKVTFQSLSYPELWQSWEKTSRLARHVNHLKQKYFFEVSPN